MVNYKPALGAISNKWAKKPQNWLLIVSYGCIYHYS